MPPERPYLGTGWSFPPSFTAQGADVRMVSGAEDIHQSLQILLSTSLGERVGREGFGCDLSGEMFEEINQGLINRVTSLVKDAILYHEPRVILDGVDVSVAEAGSGLLRIRIDYTVRTTNSRFNMVYPFYVKEASTPSA